MFTALLLFLLIYVGYQIYADPLEKGLMSFLFYLQIAGVLKRLITFYEPGIIQLVGYNFIVGLQYVLFSCILFSSIRKDAFERLTSRGIAFFFVMLSLVVISFYNSRLTLLFATLLFVLNFFPMFSYYIGKAISRTSFGKILTFLFYTSFIHIGYCLLQFFIGPFAFEVVFLETKSALLDVSTGEFFRSVPLYDNIEPLYVHFLVVFSFAGSRGNRFKLNFRNRILYRLAIFAAIFVMGNRSGLILLIFVVLFEYFHHLFKRRVFLLAFVVSVILSLNVFYATLFSFIDENAIELFSDSDFSKRLGTLGTYSDRLVGRKNATEHLNLLGHGLGSSGLITSVFENKFEGHKDIKDPNLWAHDLVGEMMIDFGLIGSLFLLYYIIRNVVRLNDAEETCFRIVLSLFLVSCLIGSSLFLGRSAYLLFLVIGFGIKSRLRE